MRRCRQFGSGGWAPWLLVTLLVGLPGCLKRRDGDTKEERPECTECHGGMLDAPFESAPPFNLSGQEEPDARGNGAHSAHLLVSDWARPVACEECHEVPEAVDSKGHIDTDYPAEVRFSLGPASAFEAQPKFDEKTGRCQDTFCHGGYFVGGRPSGGSDSEPLWTSQDDGVAACTGCHGMPPPTPHPDVELCSDCHKNIEPSQTFSRPELHVDGEVNFFLPSR